MEPDQRFKLKSHIIVREEGDGAFLFDPETGNLKYMNRTAMEIVNCLDDAKDIGQVTASIQSVFPDADPEQLHLDIDRFITQLQAHRFIDLETDTAP